MKPSVNACSHFWDDVKNLRKKHKARELKSILPEEEVNLSDEARIAAIPLLKAFVTYTLTLCAEGKYDVFDKFDTQPYLGLGWTMHKIRYGFMGRGKSAGLRMVFCENNDRFIFVYINTKPESDDEVALEKEVRRRIDYYLDL